MKYYTYESHLSNDRNPFTSTVTNNIGINPKRYFSSLDTDVYFGDSLIDEMVAIDFTIAEPKLPIYGYNSFYPNRIVSGRRTLQGTFAINFTNPMYLLDILEKIDDSIIANDYESFVYRCPEEDSTGLGIGNSPIFTKRFDITLSYGYGYEKNESLRTYNSCYQTLVGVQIVDYRQALDTEGNPILDMYSFIAKDIRYSRSLNTGEGYINPINGGSSPNAGITPPNPDDKETPSSKIKVVDGNNRKKLFEAKEQCENNSNNIGCIIFYPSIEQDTNGEYYFTLYIETINSDANNFKDVIVSIEDTDKNIDLKLNLGDISLGYTTLQLEGSYRDPTAKIFNQKNKDYEYKIPCDIEFSISVDNGTYQLELNADLEIGVDD